jgi:hypothetical protein
MAHVLELDGSLLVLSSRPLPQQVRQEARVVDMKAASYSPLLLLLLAPYSCSFLVATVIIFTHCG